MAPRRSRPVPVPFSAAELAGVARLVVPGSVFSAVGAGTAFYRPEIGTINVTNHQPGVAVIAVTSPPSGDRPAPAVFTLAELGNKNDGFRPQWSVPGDEPTGGTVDFFPIGRGGGPQVLCSGGVPVAVFVHGEPVG